MLEVGDRITRDGQTWVITSLGNFNRDGRALAVTLRPDGESRGAPPGRASDTPGEASITRRIASSS
jgi:hypothetical protein